MKTFNQFQESVAISLAKRGGSKLIPALMTGIGAAGMIMQSKNRRVPKDSEEMPDPLEGLSKRKRDKLKDVVKQLGDEIKGGVEQVKKGLSVDPKQVTGKKYRTPEMGNQDPASYVRKLKKELENRLKRQKRAYKEKQIKNKKIDRDLGKK